MFGKCWPGHAEWHRGLRGPGLRTPRSSCAGCRNAWRSARRRSTAGVGSELSAWRHGCKGNRVGVGACDGIGLARVDKKKVGSWKGKKVPTLLLALSESGRAIKFGPVAVKRVQAVVSENACASVAPTLSWEWRLWVGLCHSTLCVMCCAPCSHVPCNSVHSAI